MKETQCRASGCLTRMTWEQQRVQYGRAMRAGLSVEQWKAVGPRCQKCTTTLLRERAADTEPATLSQGKIMARTSIYQHEDEVSIVTDAKDERDFEDGFTRAFAALVANGNGNGRAVQREAIKAGFDIVAKLRGYKSDVQERRVLSAGRWPHPSEQPLAVATEADDDAE